MHRFLLQRIQNSGSAGTTHFTTKNIPLLAPATWYVATTGNDLTCTATGSPCLTINGVLTKVGFVAGDTIKVATGTYTGTGSQVVYINKDITLSGGWNATFTAQNGKSTIDGENARGGVYLFGSPGATALIEFSIVQKSNGGDAAIMVRH